MINISHVSLDRWYSFENNADTKAELNIFCDGSAQAYGAVAYFVFSNKDYKQNICSFILSKSPLSPLKEQCSIAIPKLELQAAVLAARLKCTMLEEIDFDIDKVRFWTDSKITLNYIRNSSKRLSVSIMNSLHEIRLNSNINERYFIPGKNNLADQCTRYNPLTSLTLNCLWIKGPHFLYKNEPVSFESKVPSICSKSTNLNSHLIVHCKPLYRSFIK